MVSGKNSKAVRNARAAVVTQRSTPWGLIAAVTAIVVFAGAVFGYAFLQNQANDDRLAALAPFTPTAENEDPSTQIEGVVVETYQAGQHVTPDVRVAYTQSPPFGGRHDNAWATCSGVVYPEPVRTENLVHSIEHGAVWITYDPDQVTGDDLALLAERVDNVPFMAMSPYPGLDQPISLQSWGHQLKLSDAGDVRIDQFVSALRRNPFTSPEPRGSCNAMGPGLFDQDSPPAFQPPPAESEIDGTSVVADTDAVPPVS